jgi:hypothetical protein
VTSGSGPLRPRDVDAALARIRAGQPLVGTFMHEHGLELPFVERSALSFEDGRFVHRVGGEAFTGRGYETEAIGDTVRYLDEAGARSALQQDALLRAALRG